MNVKERYTVDIVDLNHEGFGVAKIDNLATFIPGALVGEKVVCEITKIDKNFCTARLVEIIKESKDRVKPICKIFYQCGGCEIMHMNYQSQLAFKKRMATETFKRLGGLDIKVDEIIGMDEPYYYRNKIQVPYANSKGKVIAGYYKKKSHEIIPIEECFIQPKVATEIIKFVKNLANEYGVSAYDENKKQGCLRHVLVRINDKDEVMVVLITNEKTIKSLDQIVSKIINRYPNVVSIIHNINDSHSNVVLGKKHKLVYGKEYIIDQICDLSFKISHYSFFQVNRKQTNKLYNKVLEFVDPSKDDIVIDGYCGVGTIALTIARHAKHVYGVEIVKEAIEDARENAKLNGINNVKFIVGKVEEEIQNLLNDSVSTIVLDPPRKGVEPNVLDAIMATSIPKLVYVSCNVATLARDLKKLSESFEVKKMSLVDMFPQTAGVEAVCLLERR